MLQVGVLELCEDLCFNCDVVFIVSNYDIGLDWFSVVFEVDKVFFEVVCEDVVLGQYQDCFVWVMQGVFGVFLVVFFFIIMCQFNEGYNEGNLKMVVVFIDLMNYVVLVIEVV